VRNTNVITAAALMQLQGKTLENDETPLVFSW